MTPADLSRRDVLRAGGVIEYQRLLQHADAASGPEGEHTRVNSDEPWWHQPEWPQPVCCQS
ncbi:hypothetical protein [Herbihabitans rhizosphaerae]|nr:hypothetical protein [Herbihabitans rhizosphaerae]